MNTPTDLKYTDNDEWIKVDGNIAVIGITDYAQDQLSDIVFLEILVSEDETVNQGDNCGTVESVKAAADIYMPASGKVVAINEDLIAEPEKINSDPYGEAWMVKIELSDPSELDSLMGSAEYQTKIQE